MKARDLIYILVILALLYYIFTLKPASRTEYITNIDTVYQDTGSYHLTVKWKTKTLIDTLYDTTYIDTNQTITDYYTRKFYDSTIVFPNDIELNFSAVLWKNDFLSSSFNATNKRATSIIHQELPKREIYGGLEVGYNNVSPTVSYKHKNNVFRLGYNVVSDPIEKIKIGYERKIISW